MKVDAVEILHPEGSFMQRKVSQGSVESIEWNENDSVTVKKTDNSEYYPSHRVHKVVYGDSE